MTTHNAIRFLHFEAAKCRDRDACEALCLLLPALMKIHGLEPMEDVEAAAFRYGFKLELEKLPFLDAADRADARSAFLAQPMQNGGCERDNNSKPCGASRGSPDPPGDRGTPAAARPERSQAAQKGRAGPIRLVSGNA